MWTDMMCLLPLGAILSKCTIENEITLDGDLQDELACLLGKYLPRNSLVMNRNKHLKANINQTYPPKTSLWMILYGILNRYQLRVKFQSSPNDSVLAFQLEEGFAWSS